MKTVVYRITVTLAVMLATAVIGTAQTTAAQYLTLAADKYEAKDYAGAEAAATECIKLDPNAISCYYNRGLTYDRMGKFDAAVSDYTRLVALWTDSNEPYKRRAASYYKLGRLDLSLADYESAVRMKPDDAKAVEYRNAMKNLVNATANLSQGKKDLEAANKDLADKKRDVALTADKALALGDKYSLAQNYTGADEVYTISLKGVPTHLKCLHSRALAYDALKNTDAAIADLTTMLKIQPDAHTYYSRSILYRAKADHASAVLDLTEAIKLEPDSPAHYLNRGATYVLAKDYELAIPDLTQSIKLKADDARPYYMRGYAYEMTGRKALAIADYKKSLALRPDDAVVKAALAKLTAAK